MKKHTPSPTYKQKHIYSHKKCVHIRDREEPQRNTSVKETHLHTNTTSRQNVTKPFTYV
jgi:hypothetical protein